MIGSFFRASAVALCAFARGGKVVLPVRYTDVYVKQGGSWREISARETPVAKEAGIGV